MPLPRPAAKTGGSLGTAEMGVLSCWRCRNKASEDHKEWRSQIFLREAIVSKFDSNRISYYCYVILIMKNSKELVLTVSNVILFMKNSKSHSTFGRRVPGQTGAGLRFESWGNVLPESES